MFFRSKKDKAKKRLEKGLLLWSKGKLSKAVDECIKAIKEEPENIEVSYNLFKSLSDMDFFWSVKAEGKELAEKVLSIHPNNTTALSIKADTLREQGKKDEAIQYYDKILVIKPNDSSAFRSKAGTLGEMGKIEEALSHYDKSLKINPEDHYTFELKGQFLEKIGRNDEALSCYKEAMSIDWYHSNRAKEGFMRIKNIQEYEFREGHVFDEEEMMLRKKTSWEIFEFYMNKGDVDKAEKYEEKACFNNEWEVYNFYKKRGDIDKANKHYTENAVLQSKNRLQIAKYYQEKGQTEKLQEVLREMEKDLEKYSQKAKEFSGGRTPYGYASNMAAWYGTKAQIHEIKGEKEEASACYKRAQEFGEEARQY